MPPFIALTGGIGAGKTTALRALERLGAATLSNDEVVHDLYASPVVRDAVVKRFGADVAPGGTVDRATLARKAFATPEGRAWLEQLIWPLVRERTDAWRTEMAAADPSPRALVVEVPLLFEAGTQDRFDATITVTAGAQLRAQRAEERGHEALAGREARQLSQEEKAARSTFVVSNDGDIAELEHKLSAVLAMLQP